MPRRLGAAVAFTSAIVAGGMLAHAESPTTVMVGGLTAPPAVTPGPNRLPNGGFEAGIAPWSSGAGWGLDRKVTHAGAVSYRRDAGAPTTATTVELLPGVYRFSAWVKTKELAGGARLRLDLRPRFPSWFTAEIEPGTADWRRYEVTDVVVTESTTVTLKLEADAGVAGTAWFDDVRLEQQLPQPLQTFLLYPNFRGLMFDDGPATLTFELQVTPPDGDIHRYTVRGLLRDDASGRVVTARAYPARAALVAELDGSGMRPGAAYVASFELIDNRSGTQVSASPAYRVSRAPAAAHASMPVSLDRRNRVLMAGVPRFLLGGDNARIARGTPAGGLQLNIVDACAPTAEAAFAHYDGVRRRDARAVTLAVAGPTELGRWRDGADIVATEPQPMFGPEPADGYDHRAVAEATARSRAAVRDARPIVSVLPFAPLSPFGRWPTRAELRSHAYMAIVEGARGLWWSSVGGAGCDGSCADQARHMDNLRSVIDELATLEPVLLADDTPAALAGHSNSNIKAKVKVVNGKGFVLAYNTSSNPQSATFTWRTAPGTVTVHTEGRSVAADGRSFSDTFAAFGAHVYVVEPFVGGVN
jgi:hypothetical protein